MHLADRTLGTVDKGSYSPAMIHRVEYYRSGKLLHRREVDLGLEAAKQAASAMAKAYGADDARVFDKRGNELFNYVVPTGSASAASRSA